MGAFFKAFWTRMGRNTGNRVSNAIFGDKWATPYRVAVNRDANGKNGSHGSNTQKSRSRGHAGPSRASAKSSAHSSGRSSAIYWIAGIVLFCGTYNAIINPNKDDIVLLLMLWVVAIVWAVIRFRTARR